jgi:putative spermidine/putrescine transport system substrate-binding protein
MLIGRIVALLLSMAMLAPSLARATEITMMTWGGAFLDAFKIAAAEFEEQTGHRVIFVTQVGAVGGYTTVKTQRSAPQVDILATIESLAQLAPKDDLAVPLDLAKMPAASEIPADLRDATSVPVWLSPRGIFYRKDLVPFEIRSWKDLWDPRLKGRVGVSITLDNASFLIMAALINGGSEKAIEPGFQSLATLKPNVAAVYKTDLEAIRLLQTGEIAVAGWGGLSNVSKLLGPDSNYRFVLPEGPQLLPLARVFVVKGRSPEQTAAAQQFVNLLASADMQAKMTRVTNTIPVNPKAERPESLRTFVPDKLSPYQIDWSAVNEGYPTWLTRWQKVLQ